MHHHGHVTTHSQGTRALAMMPLTDQNHQAAQAVAVPALDTEKLSVSTHLYQQHQHPLVRAQSKPPGCCKDSSTPLDYAVVYNTALNCTAQTLFCLQNFVPDKTGMLQLRGAEHCAVLTRTAFVRHQHCRHTPHAFPGPRALLMLKDRQGGDASTPITLELVLKASVCQGRAWVSGLLQDMHHSTVLP